MLLKLVPEEIFMEFSKFPPDEREVPLDGLGLTGYKGGTDSDLARTEVGWIEMNGCQVRVSKEWTGVGITRRVGMLVLV